MTLDFTVKEFILGGGAGTPPLQFFRRGFNLGGSGSQPSWRDIILSGNTALTLVNSKADGLNYLKLFGGCEQRNLPVGYTQYEYLRSTGTQYIDLGYKGNGKTKVKVKFRYHTATGTTGSGRVCGSRISSTNNAFAIGSASGIVSSTNNDVFWCYDGQPYFVDDTNFGLDEWKTVVFSATEHTIDGVTVGDDYTVTTFETPENLKLFGFDNNGTMGVGYVDIAYCQLWDDDFLVRDVVPVGDGTTYGMYDKVSGAMLPNEGTGNFAVGGVVSSPTPDTPISIISNNGALKYGVNQTYNTADGQGTFVTPSPLTTNRIYKAFGQLKAGKYKVKITGDFEFIFQYKDTNDMSYTQYGNVGTWTTEGEYEITDTSMYYGVAIRNGSGSGSINPSSFDNVGTIGYTYLGVTPVGTVETINVHGKNLYDLVTSENLANNGLVRPTKGDNELVLTGAGSSANFSVMSFAKVADLEGKTVTLSYDNPTNNGSIVFVYCNADGTNRKAVTTSSITISSLEAEGRTDIALRVNAPTTDPTVVFRYTNIQIELGSTATTYEPYYNGGTATAEMLLKVGDYQDVQSVLDGVVTRNVGVLVLDGTESWVKGTSFYADISLNALQSVHSCICNYYAGKSTNSYSADSNTIQVGYSMGSLTFWNRVYITANRAVYATANDFKQFLADQYNAGTPVIVVYPLDEPTTETVTAQPLTIQAGTNVVAITQASMNNLELEVSYKAGVEVTVTEIENAQLDNSVEVTING